MEIPVNANRKVELMDCSTFDGFRRPPTPVRQWTWAGVGSWQETLEAGLKVRRADLAERRREWDAALRDLDLGEPALASVATRHPHTVLRACELR